MHDRMLVENGQPQLYGSQLGWNRDKGTRELLPIEDEANVDQRRLEMGLEPLAQYLRRFGLEYEGPSGK